MIDLSKVPEEVLNKKICIRAYDSITLRDRLYGWLKANGQTELEAVESRIDDDGNLVSFDAWTKDLVISLIPTIFGDMDLRAFFRNPKNARIPVIEEQIVKDTSQPATAKR